MNKYEELLKKIQEIKNSYRYEEESNKMKDAIDIIEELLKILCNKVGAK